MFYKKNNPHKKMICRQTLVFILICIAFAVFFILTCTPAAARTVLDYSGEEIQKTEGRILEIPVKPGEFIPGIGDFIIIGIKTENTGNVKYPTSSITVIWGHVTENQDDYGMDIDLEEVKKRQDCSIRIDGIEHSYYVPVGENPAWTQKSEVSDDNYDSSTNGDLTGNDYISSISIELPEIEGVDITISEVRLLKRPVFPLDSYINYAAKKSMNIEQINRLLTPSYIFLALSLILSFIYVLIFRRTSKKAGSSPDRDKSQHGYGVTKILVYISVAILLIFSFYFMALNFFTVKSYVDSYKKYILQAEFDKTYEGFYNFRRFISWIAQKVPEGENIIVLLTGEPVYTMSELAYNLYPRDIRFIDIRQKNDSQILNEIEKINQADKNGNFYYRYIVILSYENIPQTTDWELIGKYSENSGFLYKLR